MRFCVAILACLCVSHMAHGQGGDNPGSSLASIPVPSSGNVCFNVKCPTSLPTTCKDVKGPPVRKITVLYDGTEVVCDTKTDNGGWTIIQRRTDGSVDFYRNWANYKYGFGNLTGEFWLGLETIHQMTSKRCYELRIDLKYSRKDYYAKYSYIKVWGDKESYRLDLGTYSGDAGDSLAPHRNKPFTTKDVDNDDSDDNCAAKYNGAWWFASCLKSDLNGRWNSNQYAWQTLTGDDNISFSEMKIRPCYN